jgi:hypothetical protein
MDKNPKVTEALAAIFMDNPMFEDIAENIEPPQKQHYYLLTTLSIPHMIQAVSINLIKAQAMTTQGESITATTDAIKLITNAIKIDGSLKGKVPEPFTGD